MFQKENLLQLKSFIQDKIAMRASISVFQTQSKVFDQAFLRKWSYFWKSHMIWGLNAPLIKALDRAAHLMKPLLKFLTVSYVVLKLVAVSTHWMQKGSKLGPSNLKSCFEKTVF